MRCELTGYHRPARLAFRTTMAQADIAGTLTFDPVPGGTRMRWTWTVRPKGASRRADLGDQPDRPPPGAGDLDRHEAVPGNPAAAAVAYLPLIELGKYWFYRSCHEPMAAAAGPARRRRVHHRAAASPPATACGGNHPLSSRKAFVTGTSARGRRPPPGPGSDAGPITHSPVEREMSRYAADHAGLEILPYDECLRLLGTVPVGRVSFFADGEIVVLPVNHVMDGHDPVFRTARGRSCPPPRARTWWRSRRTPTTSGPGPDGASWSTAAPTPSKRSLRSSAWAALACARG